MCKSDYIDICKANLTHSLSHDFSCSVIGILCNSEWSIHKLDRLINHLEMPLLIEYIMCVQKSASAPSCSKEYMPEGDKKLTDLKAADMSRGQLFAITFAFILKHRLTKRGVSDLIDLMNTMLPNCLPPNSYHFNKILDVDDTIDTHVYCSKCNTYIGKLTDGVSQSACPNCQDCVNFDESVKMVTFSWYIL